MLFGLADWKFEVMGLLMHSRELERFVNIGPHTISVPRLHPASGSDISRHTPAPFTDEDFVHALTVLRLSVPYTGLILTARESVALRDRCVGLGITQMDASTRIGIGAYSDEPVGQEIDKQQFMLGDNRTLEELICDLARRGIIILCTTHYRCGRTGGCIMDALKTGKEGKFCKVNAVLTFASGSTTRLAGSPEDLRAGAVAERAEAIREQLPSSIPPSRSTTTASSPESATSSSKPRHISCIRLPTCPALRTSRCWHLRVRRQSSLRQLPTKLVTK